jgi:hypothetical protein
MKRTVELDEKLVEEATRVAEAHGGSVIELLEDAVREKLSRVEVVEDDEKLTIERTEQLAEIKQRLHNDPVYAAEYERISASMPVFHGDGLRPGVDLEDHEALQDLLDLDDPLIQDLIRRKRLQTEPEFASAYRQILAEFPPSGTGGLLPGIDLDDHAAMDELDGLNDRP